MTNSSKQEVKGALTLVIHFTRQIIFATGLFIIIGCAAILLKYFHDLLKFIEMPEIIVDITKYAELFLFAVDIICFFFFIIYEAVTFLKEIWHIFQNEV